jgi:DNA excision repair protein ERCC-4
MMLIVDTREQKPYLNIFKKINQKYLRKKLDVGDYSLKNYENKFAIERKTLDDFICSITRGRKRFEKELEKAKSFEYFALIIECSFYDIKNRNYYSKIEPEVILSTIFKWSTKYKIPIFFMDTRVGGALAVVKLAEGFLRYHKDVF